MKVSHSQNTTTDQKTFFQILLTKPLISYSLQIEKSMHYIYSGRNITNKEKVISKPELNHKFRKPYELESTIVLHRNLKVNPNDLRNYNQ